MYSFRIRRKWWQTILFLFSQQRVKIFSDGKPGSEKGGDNRKSSESSSKYDAGNKAMSNNFKFSILNIIFPIPINVQIVDNT